MMDLDIYPIAVASREEDAVIARLFDWDVIECENRPLGNKWNALTKRIGELEEDDSRDFAIIIGDDDYLSVGYIQNVRHLFDMGVEYTSPETAYMLDGDSGRVVKFRGKVTLGGGRAVSVDLLRACDWSPWEDHVETGLDHSFDKSLRAIEKQEGRSINFSVCDGAVMTIKTNGVQMWSFDFLLTRTLWSQVELRELRPHFHDLFDKLRYV